MKTYRRHNCQGRHTTWPDLATCTWPEAVVSGDGPFAALSCGGATVALYGARAQATACKRGHDRDGCSPCCTRRHDLVLLDPAEREAP